MFLQKKTSCETLGTVSDRQNISCHTQRWRQVRIITETAWRTLRRSWSSLKRPAGPRPSDPDTRVDQSRRLHRACSKLYKVCLQPEAWPARAASLFMSTCFLSKQNEVEWAEMLLLKEAVCPPALVSEQAVLTRHVRRRRGEMRRWRVENRCGEGETGEEWWAAGWFIKKAF